MVGTSWSCADLVFWGEHQQNGSVLIQFNGLSHVELVGTDLLLGEAQVLEEVEKVGKEHVLQVLSVEGQGWGKIGRSLQRFQPLPFLPARTKQNIIPAHVEKAVQVHPPLQTTTHRERLTDSRDETTHSQQNKRTKRITHLLKLGLFLSLK